MPQTRTSAASENQLNLLVDADSHRFIATLPGAAWAQAVGESGRDFYLRLQAEFTGDARLAPAAAALENYSSVLLNDNYVDPVLYEAGFFKDKAHHDGFMQRVLANFDRKK